MLQSGRMAARKLRRTFGIAAAALLVSCAVVSRPSEGPRRPTPSSTANGAANASRAAFPTPTLGGPSADELRQLQQQVVGLRGLSPAGPLPASLDETPALGQTDITTDVPPGPVTESARLFALLGLLDGRSAEASLHRAVSAERIPPAYDPTGERLLTAVDSAWTGVERLVYLHSVAIALLDQTYHLGPSLNYTGPACLGDDERCRALAALIEGDATLVAEQWLRTYARPIDLDDLLTLGPSRESSVAASAPPTLQEDLLFPYRQGLEYVRTYYLRGGWAAVDQLYAHPPETTEAILHPGAFLGALHAVPLADAAAGLGGGWREAGRGVVGEWLVRLMLETQLDESEAEAAAAGWGGDAFVTLRDETTAGEALLLVIQWDRASDAYEFATAMTHHAHARFGPTAAAPDGSSWSWQDGRARLVRAYTQTLWILAPTASEAEAILRSIRFPVPT